MAGAAAPDGRTLLIACGALAREVLALMRANGLQDRMALTCLPAVLHNRPEQIPDRLRRRIRTARDQGWSRIAVAYADCGTGGAIDRVCAEEGVRRIPGPHCYAFYAGQSVFDALAGAEPGTFYLTDFLVRQFDQLVIEGLGLDRHPQLLPLYFGNYSRVVYLAQTDDPALDARARAAAARLGLAYERHPTGYGELSDFIRAA